MPMPYTQRDLQPSLLQRHHEPFVMIWVTAGHEIESEARVCNIFESVWRLCRLYPSLSLAFDLSDLGDLVSFFSLIENGPLGHNITLPVRQFLIAVLGLEFLTAVKVCPNNGQCSFVYQSLRLSGVRLSWLKL